MLLLLLLLFCPYCKFVKVKESGDFIIHEDNLREKESAAAKEIIKERKERNKDLQEKKENH